MSGERRVLIFRLGSLGDTVVGLPGFHLIARSFPDAERRVLTNIPVEGRAAPLAAVLGESGLAHGYMRYPIGLRDPAALWRLGREVAAFAPDVLVYLTDRRAFLPVLRDIAFFRLCGIPRLVGAPVRAGLRRHRFDPVSGLYEREAHRLGRCLAPLGDVRLGDRGSWDLRLSPAERAAAEAALAGWPGALGADGFVAFSIGAKSPVKDWGDDNWRAVLAALRDSHGGMGLALIGAAEEAERSTALAAGWAGPVINLCGSIAPRVSAQVIAAARLFLGHDSGPMHLADAVGTPAVVVFGTLAPPGQWFPFGHAHRLFYPGIGPDGGSAADGIAAIRPAPVIAAARAVLTDARR